MAEVGLGYLIGKENTNSSTRSPISHHHTKTFIETELSQVSGGNSSNAGVVSASTASQEPQRVILNVGGTKFETLVETITRFGKDTMLSAMLSFHSETKSEYFIDRDPEIFRHILNWYRTGMLLCPQGVPAKLMEQELEYYGIPKEQMRVYQKQFTLAGKRVWSCKSCGIHLADHRDIHSKNFNGKNGMAILFDSVVNVSEGESKDKDMMSGKHLVADITCNNCNSYVGWTYINAYEELNKYKVGKSVLEKTSLIKERNTF